MSQFTKLTPEGLLDFRGITAPQPGVLPGAPGTGGSPAAGQKPAVPDPSATQAGALAGNLANLAQLRQLFNKTSQTVGIGPGMMQAETANINNLLNPPSQFVDINRMAAEAGTGSGVAGSPAAETRGYRMTDEEMLRRRLLGTSLLNQRAQRANEILSPQQFMIRPESQQAWQNLANMVASAPDPELAFRRALDLAKAGTNRGFNAGYGGGAPRPSVVTSPSGVTAVPTWPTLPVTAPPAAINPSGPSSVYAPPNSNAGEDWLASLGLGLGQPGVTTTPLSSFMGDINPTTDWYA